MTLHISSRDNPLYKLLKRVAQGRADPYPVQDRGKAGTETRTRAGTGTGAGIQAASILLEGVHLCHDWLRYRGQPERAIFDTTRFENSPELQHLSESVDADRTVSMDAALLKSISPIACAQGVCFLVRHEPPAIPKRIEHDCIWLDRIQDPGNVGTLLRTAAAAGIKHAYLSTGCAGAWTSRVLRSAQGAHFVMLVYEHVNLMHLCERLAIPLYATAVNDTALSIYEANLAGPCAWVFGNEGQGVEPGMQAAADHCVYVPQEPVMESLNVAVAAGICLFEQRRQQKRHG